MKIIPLVTPSISSNGSIELASGPEDACTYMVPGHNPAAINNFVIAGSGFLKFLEIYTRQTRVSSGDNRLQRTSGHQSRIETGD